MLTPSLKFTYHFPDDFHTWPEDTKRRVLDRIAKSSPNSVELWLNQNWEEFQGEFGHEFEQDVIVETQSPGYVDENDENPIRNPEGFRIQIRIAGDDGVLGDQPVNGLHPAYVISDDGEIIV